MTQLTIAMPSNRSLQRSRAAIETALTYAEKVDCRLIVADNSGDAEKRAFLSRLSKRLVYVVSDAPDAAANLMVALVHADTPFVMPAADDDELYLLDGIQPVDLAALPADTVGMRPLSYCWSGTDGVRSVARFEISAQTAAARLLEYNSKAGGNNAMYYSTYRTDIFRGLIKLFIEAHPTRGGYCDWALTFALAAGGKFAHDPATIYRYDLGNWAGQEEIDASNAELYNKAGLPENARRFDLLLRFVDTHIFLLWPGLKIEPAERQDAIVANARLALGSFIRTVEANPDGYGEEVVYLTQMLQETQDIDSAFQIAVLILDRMQPGLAARYVDFFRTATAA